MPEYIQGNNFSGLVSNILCERLTSIRPTNTIPTRLIRTSINPNQGRKAKPAGLEVKSTIQIGKGGESHNGHSGWHWWRASRLNQRQEICEFVHVMLAVLNGHTQPEPDWVYVGSKVNMPPAVAEPRHTTPTLIGTTKLRDGSVYLDPQSINFKRWRAEIGIGPVPHYSIFACLREHFENPC